jgi:hypothetical protein
MAEFRKLSDVEVVAEPAESANVLIEENGVIKKAPKTAVGGTGGGDDGNYFISFDGDEWKDSIQSYPVLAATENLYQKIADRLDNKMNVDITLYDYRYYDQPEMVPYRLYRIILRDDSSI